MYKINFKEDAESLTKCRSVKTTDVVRKFNLDIQGSHLLWNILYMQVSLVSNKINIQDWCFKFAFS